VLEASIRGKAIQVVSKEPYFINIIRPVLPTYNYYVYLPYSLADNFQEALYSQHIA
jgi:hypothetical protein